MRNADDVGQLEFEVDEVGDGDGEAVCRVECETNAVGDRGGEAVWVRDARSLSEGVRVSLSRVVVRNADDVGDGEAVYVHFFETAKVLVWVVVHPWTRRETLAAQG